MSLPTAEEEEETHNDSEAPAAKAAPRPKPTKDGPVNLDQFVPDVNYDDGFFDDERKGKGKHQQKQQPKQFVLIILHFNIA